MRDCIDVHMVRISSSIDAMLCFSFREWEGGERKREMQTTKSCQALLISMGGLDDVFSVSLPILQS